VPWFLHYFQLAGHSTEECRSVGVPKEQQRSTKKKLRGKKKGKEKAHNTTDGGGGDSGSKDECSHLVKFKKCLAINTTNFSHYSQFDGNSLLSPNNPEVRAYSTCPATNSPTIIINSGTTSHIHSNRADFKSLKSSSSGLINGFGEGSRTIEGRGKALLLAQLPTSGQSHLKLQSTCYVPNSTPTLISVPHLDNADCYTLFGNGRCVTFKNQDNGKLLQESMTKGKVIFTGTKGPDQLYHLDMPRQSKESSYSITRSPMSKLEQLHYSLGHLNYQAIKAMVCKGLIKGITLSKKELSITPPICAACAKGKATRASFPASKSGHADKILGPVHSDLWGPAPVQTITGTQYVITFTDDKSHWVWVAFLKRKSDAFTAFKEWLIFVEKQTGQQLHIFHTDNGGEFITKVWRKFMKDRGICHETTSPYTPEQNSDAERQNRSIFDCVCTVLIDAGLPLSLFAEAVNYIFFTKNRNSTSALTNTTPYEVRFNKKPDLSRLRPFSCKAYVYDHSPKRKKLSPQAFEGIFIGYADSQKAYRIYIPEKRTVICSVHVRFDVNTNMGNRFRAEVEIQFQYNSLKSTFQEFTPERSSSPDSVPPTTSSDDFDSDSAPEHVANVPEHVPTVPVHILAPPDPPAHRPCQPRPPPRAPSSHPIRPTERGDTSHFQKAGLSNSVPFPSGTDTEPNVDPGGVPAEEEADEQELANIAHGEEPRTHKQAMASPDAAE
jgi:Integrase core domain/GAG-pre-integrase domain